MLKRLLVRASVLLDILLVDEVDFYLFSLTGFTIFATQSSPSPNVFLFKYYRSRTCFCESSTMSTGWIKSFVLAVVNDKPSSIIWKCSCEIGNTPRTKLSLFSSTTALSIVILSRDLASISFANSKAPKYFHRQIEASERRQPEKGV